MSRRRVAEEGLSTHPFAATISANDTKRWWLRYARLERKLSGCHRIIQRHPGHMLQVAAKKEEALHSSRAGKRRRGITNWCCRLSVNGSDPSPEATSALSVEKREQGSGHPAVSLGKGPRGSRFDKTQASGSEKRGVFRLGARATPEILARRPRSPAVLS